MKTLAIGITVAAAACPIIVEVIRSSVHRRRERIRGLGGTQDIAMIGAIVGWTLIVLAVGAWVMHFAS